MSASLSLFAYLVCMLLYLTVCLSACVSVRLSLCVCLSIHKSVCLSVCEFVHLSLFVYLSACLPLKVCHVFTEGHFQQASFNQTFLPIDDAHNSSRLLETALRDVVDNSQRCVYACSCAASTGFPPRLRGRSICPPRRQKWPVCQLIGPIFCLSTKINTHTHKYVCMRARLCL